MILTWLLIVTVSVWKKDSERPEQSMEVQDIKFSESMITGPKTRSVCEILIKVTLFEGVGAKTLLVERVSWLSLLTCP